jgi:hypothetical protein
LIERRYAHNVLFRPGPNLNLNACVGENGGPYDFAAYGEGFFHAGFEIIEAINRGAWTREAPRSIEAAALLSPFDPLIWTLGSRYAISGQPSTRASCNSPDSTNSRRRGLAFSTDIRK